MKKLLFTCLVPIVLVMLLPCLGAAEADYLWAYQSNGLAQYERDGKIGLIDSASKIVTAAQYEGMMFFDNYGYAQVYEYKPETNEITHTGLIDRTGSLIIPFGAYQRIVYMPPVENEGFSFFVCYDKGVMDFYALTGERIDTSQNWINLCRSSTGIGFVTTREDNTKWYLLDKKGNVINDEAFIAVREMFQKKPTEAGVITNRMYVGYAETAEGYKIVDDSGNVLREYKYAEDASVLPSSFYDMIEAETKLVAWYDENGNPFDLKGFDNWTETGNHFIVQKDNLFGVIGSDRATVILPVVHERLIPILNDSHRGYIGETSGSVFVYDIDGETTFSAAWDNIWAEAEVYIITSNGKKGIVSAVGELQVSPVWDDIYFSGFPEVYVVYDDENDMYGLVQAGDQIVLEPKWSTVFRWEDSSNGTPTFYAEADDGTGGLFSYETSDLKALSSTFEPFCSTLDRTVYSQTSSNGGIMAWVLFDNTAFQILQQYSLAEVNFTEPDHLSSYVNVGDNFLYNIEANGAVGFINDNGDVIANPEWAMIFPYQNDDLMIVRTVEEKYGVITRKGDYIVPPVWDMYSTSSADSAFITIGEERLLKVGLRDAQDNMSYGYIDNEGNPVCGIKLYMKSLLMDLNKELQYLSEIMDLL